MSVYKSYTSNRYRSIRDFVKYSKYILLRRESRNEGVPVQWHGHNDNIEQKGLQEDERKKGREESANRHKQSWYCTPT